MIPNYEAKHDAEALFTPEEVLAAQGDGLPDVPPAVILGYQPALTEAVERRARGSLQLVRSQELYRLTATVGYVPVHRVGIGAPIAATVTENLIAAGATAVVLLGAGAGLQPDIAPDAAILPTAAIRDEGVSYHYVPDGDPVSPTPPLVDALADALAADGFETSRGQTWTTSAFYRETVPEITHYRERGVVTLDMESAAIWAVCQYRGTATATIHALGDMLLVDEWVPETSAERGLEEMLGPTIAGIETFLAGP